MEREKKNQRCLKATVRQDKMDHLRQTLSCHFKGKQIVHGFVYYYIFMNQGREGGSII